MTREERERLRLACVEWEGDVVALPRRAVVEILNELDVAEKAVEEYRRRLGGRTPSPRRRRGSRQFRHPG